MERGGDGAHRTQLRGTERERDKGRQRERKRGGEAFRLKRRDREES